MGESAKARRLRGKGRKSKRAFLLIYRNIKRSKAYHSLTVYARALLLELIDRYTGNNNGIRSGRGTWLPDEVRSRNANTKFLNE